MKARLLVAASLLLAACSGSPSTTPTTSGPVPSRTPTRHSATATPTEIPDLWRFDARAVGGGTIDGARFAGAKAAVWLWAPW